MRFFTVFSLVFILSLTVHSAHAQFGKLLKDKLVKVAKSDALKKKVKSAALENLEKAKSEYDTTSFNYAISLSDNAGLFESKEKFERNQKLLMQYLNKDEVKEPLEQAEGYINTGEMLYASNKFTLAKTSFILAKTIYEIEDATDDVHYAKVIANLGLLAHTTGRYTLAEELSTQAMEMRLEKFGENSKGYAASINNVAVLQKDMGDYNAAEKLIDEALMKNEKVHGNESMPYAITLNNKAILFQTLGRYEEAEPLLKNSIDVAKNNIGEKSVNYQRLLTNLALLYQDMERFNKAEEIYNRVIALKERFLGKKQKHPDYAHMLNLLASLYVQMGKDAQVEDLLTRSASIYEAKFGKDHPAYASSLSSLGSFYRYKGQNEKAMPKIREALEIRQRALGETHPDYINSKEEMAILLWKAGDYNASANMYKEVLDTSLDFINAYFPPMSEVEKTRYWDKLRPRFERFNAFAMDIRRIDETIIGDMYNYHVATKALLMTSSTKVKKQILNSGDTELIDQYLLWLDQKESLAHLFSFSKADLVEENINLDSLQRATNQAEKELSAKSAIFSEGYAVKNVSYTDIRKQLGSNEAAIELIHYNAFDQSFTGNVEYAALIIIGGQRGVPKVAHIKNGKELETKYYSYYKNAIRQKVQDQYSYAQYWGEIDKITGHVSKINLSLDGIYNQINIASLRTPSGKFIIDTKELTILSNTKDLIGLDSKKSNPVKKALLVGFPNYGSSDIVPLPGTKVEVESINRILKNSRYSTELLMRDKAGEGALKKVKSPKILHIATHGFFQKDIDNQREHVFGVQPYHAVANPLLRSGLMLNGAGKMNGDVKQPVGNDNGILTAYEAMNMSLDDTDIVVLSACETGLGDVKAGEGVYGLQRAFLVAGSDAVIMSLWKVDDAATQQLMTSFYTNWVRYGNMHKAFRQAQIQLKAKFKEPYYWGAFVLIGA